MRFFIFFIFFISTTLYKINAQSLDLTSGGWRFNQGDDSLWAKPAFDDQAWPFIPIGQTWETSTKKPYDGLAWYRKTIIIPSKLKAACAKYGVMSLSLGKIDDADETYFNGVKIGATGKFPPASASAYDAVRKYLVPSSLIAWDQPNLIAVRVSDTGGGGGMYEGEYALEAASWKSLVQTSVSNSEAVQYFKAGRPVRLNFDLNNLSDENIRGVLVCEIKTFTGTPVTLQTKTAVFPSKNRRAVPFSFNIQKSGFFIAYFQFKSSEGAVIEAKNGFAVDPEKTVKPVSRPADFSRYWQKARNELNQIAPEFAVTPQPDRSTDKIEVSLVEMKSLGGVRVKGWYVVPKNLRGAKIPAVLHLQGYSSVMEPFSFLSDKTAGLFFNIRGHGVSKDDVNPGFPGYLLTGIESPETYIYRGAYMDCIRAMDFLYSRPEIDTSRIAVEGGSQGGALSLATAALDKRVKLCLPDVPFLSDFRTYFQIAAWPANEFKDYTAKTGVSWERVYQTLDYIDVTNLAPEISCPVVMGSGLFDVVCPAEINFAAYNGLKSTDKIFYLYPQSGHSLPDYQKGMKERFVRDHWGL